ncbi:MAG: nuclear transport factor 2 family protein [Alphaproteobacteria bacterium]
MEDVTRLLAIEDIKQLKSRYFRAIDTHDWELLATVFAEDAVFDFTEANFDPNFPDPDRTVTPPVHGRDAIVDAVRTALNEAASAHHGHLPEIEVTSETTAKGIIPMEDNVRNVSGAVDFQLKGYGYYEETYEKIDGRWQIKTSFIRRLWVDLSGQTKV